MKKAFRRVVLGIVALVLVLGIGILVYIWPMLHMYPDASGPVGTTGVYAVENGLNSVYFIEDDDGYIAVDAGTDAGALADAMATEGISPEDVRHVLLTHTDGDHVAALGLFANAVVYLAAEEQQMVDGNTKRNLLERNSLPTGVMARLVPVAEGETLQLGGHRVIVVLAPGHTPGSAAFLVDGESLFTGDAFRAKDGVAEVHPYTMDKSAAAASIETLLAVPCTTIFTAHYGHYEAGSLTA